MIREWLAVAAGGALGALGRHALGRIFALLGQSWLPFATLSANVLGCLAIGYLAHWSFQHQQSQHWLVIGARVGILGGLTTFSSFALEVFGMWQAGRPVYAAGLAAIHLTVGLAAVALGVAMARH